MPATAEWTAITFRHRDPPIGFTPPAAQIPLLPFLAGKGRVCTDPGACRRSWRVALPELRERRESHFASVLSRTSRESRAARRERHGLRF